MKSNRFAAHCADCGEHTPAGCGTVQKAGRKWVVSCGECRPFDPTGQVNVIKFSSGAVITINRRGRCEDAPCCGCCS